MKHITLIYKKAIMKVKRPLHALYQRVEKLTTNILASTKSRF